MKRLISLLLAFGALATGCYSHSCDTANVNVYWSFTSATGAAQTCAQAGVTQVRIYIDSQPYNGPGTSPTLNCDPFGTGVEGVTLTGFTTGSYQFQVEGYDASGTLRYIDSQTVSVQGCGTQQVNLALLSTTGDFGVTYSFNGSCTPVNGQSAYPTTFIWYQLLDSSGHLASAAKLGQNATAIPCDNTTRTFAIPQLPFDSYTLAGIEEVQLNADGTYFVYRYNCPNAGPYAHAAQGDGFTAPAMVQQVTGGTVACFQ